MSGASRPEAAHAQRSYKCTRAGGGAVAGTRDEVGSTTRLLREIGDFIRKYVVVSAPQSLALALWVLHTHVIEAAHATPYISITSAEKECGKTRLLEVMELLVARAWFTGRTTAAALARRTDAELPTLLLDESDAAFNGDREYAEGLRSLLNSGYRRGGKTTLCVGQGANLVTRDFSTFGPKAIAGIGHLPDTVASRSVLIQLKRRAPGEQVERWHYRRAKQSADRLCEDIAAWASEHESALQDVQPEPVEQLSDRAEECWEPLFAIADLAGGGICQLARSAAVQLYRCAQKEERSQGVLLLAAIKTAFRAARTVWTEALLATINSDDELPFGGYREGQGLDARGLARLLAPYGIRPHTVRVGAKTLKGYSRLDFEDAWQRYLASAPLRASQASPPTHTRTSKAQEPHDVTDVTDVTLLPATKGAADAYPARMPSGTDATAQKPSPRADATDEFRPATAPEETRALRLLRDHADLWCGGA
jgi:hypothetical protein